jgi:Ser-tRNA(Ala) deacylase AlaX
MKASTEKLPDSNDVKKVKAYFEKVYADMDFERVYTSDMKKMVKWFEVLVKHNIEIKLSELPAEETEAIVAKAKPTEQKTAAVKNAPAKKINSPRKMA